MKILLTGGTGYLGSNLLKLFLKEGYQIVLLKRSSSDLSRISTYISDITCYNLDEIELCKVFQKQDIELVLHVATDYGRQKEEDLELIQSNLLFPLELLNLAIENSCIYFINVDTSLERLVNRYSLTKKMFRDWLLLKSNQIKVINTIPEYFYGKEDSSWKFITTMAQKIKNDEYIPLTSCEQKRDFIYIDDIIEAYKCILKHKDSFDEYIDIPIGSGNAIALKDLLFKIKEIYPDSQAVLDFGVLERRQNEVEEQKADTSFLNKLGWSNLVDINKGLELTLNTK
ncbi:NAD-dependent epimerase/dehydratase family protein [Sediminitomix flava]|uniref:Nucleoside-diphosphate-sugar epimerase n=1 Tax=Sediminitomix flava TaxID=379075 RepID=A0A315ZDT2_SEDFL|nr:NAD-dependent epimerase/dehydratase family protein [Sediminitomix flava]PWJ43310.1 nucleoside-diphosphate-sugar epimerase [Sediminitomix flava]